MSQTPQINAEIPISHATPHRENAIEGELVMMPQDTIESFMTSKGSIYTYDDVGHTTRFKAATGEVQPEQGITVFVEAGVKDAPRVAAAYLLRSSTNKTRIEVVEAQEDGAIKIIKDATEVVSPDRLLVATFRDDRVVKSRSASLLPIIGRYPFDSRTFEEGGEVRTERHIGHRVTSIQHKIADAN